MSEKSMLLYSLKYNANLIHTKKYNPVHYTQKPELSQQNISINEPPD